jgi:hypothetical protein
MVFRASEVGVCRWPLGREDQHHWSRKIEVICDVNRHFLDQVLHVASAQAAGGKFLSAQDHHIVIGAVRFFVVYTIETADRRVLAGNAMLPGYSGARGVRRHDEVRPRRSGA